MVVFGVRKTRERRLKGERGGRAARRVGRVELWRGGGRMEEEDLEVDGEMEGKDGRRERWTMKLPEREGRKEGREGLEARST